eukprot:TRINITY_DN33310_c0_g1_i1.p1 TRINITY_DN33310_c0_g1~~TRINITY_DN33310_c0_g1_i1.p1  ORF type:complete len:632 (+),score=240.99 TRINITY_DN33310_c0_g1_i1:63-1958(+)
MEVAVSVDDVELGISVLSGCSDGEEEDGAAAARAAVRACRRPAPAPAPAAAPPPASSFESVRAACVCMSVRQLREALERGGDGVLLLRDAEGRTPLLLAASAALLADEDDVAGEGDSVAELVEEVLLRCEQAGVAAQALGAADMFGRVPLHAALLARRSSSAQEAERQKHEAAADIAARTLVWACRRHFPSALSARTSHGDTPLHLAARAAGVTEAGAPGRPPAVTEDILLALCAVHDDDMRGLMSAARPPSPVVSPSPSPCSADPWASVLAVQQHEAALAATHQDSEVRTEAAQPADGCLLSRNDARALPLTCAQAATVLRETRHKAVAVALLGSRSAAHGFGFAITAEDIEAVLQREGSRWLDVLDMMVEKADPPARYRFDAVCCAGAGLVVVIDEASDWAVCLVLLLDGLWFWAALSVAVLVASQSMLPILLHRTDRSESYRHALQWLPHSRLRCCPVAYHALVFYRATRALHRVRNLSEAKSLLGLTYSLAFMEALLESLPQALLQFFVYREKMGAGERPGQREELLLYLSVAFSLISILKAAVTYAWFKWMHRAGATGGSGSNVLGIVRLPETHSMILRDRQHCGSPPAQRRGRQSSCDSVAPVAGTPTRSELPFPRQTTATENGA